MHLVLFHPLNDLLNDFRTKFLLGATVIWCLIALLNVLVDAQRDAKWSWSANNRNNIDGSLDRPVDRRKYEDLEDLR